MNTVFALILLIAYAVIHARKEKIHVIDWAKKNWLALACSAAILIGIALIPKPVLMAFATWFGTPFLLALALKWGVVSVVSNAIRIAGAWIKAFTSNL